MSDLRSSSDIQSLLEAARSDGPTSAARANMWSAVANTVGVTAAAGGGAAAAGLGGMGAAKMLLIGTLLGGPITVGLAAAVLYQHSGRGSEATPSVAQQAGTLRRAGLGAPGSMTSTPTTPVDGARKTPGTAPQADESPVLVLDPYLVVAPSAATPTPGRGGSAFAHAPGAVSPAQGGSAVSATPRHAARPAAKARTTPASPAPVEDDLVREASLLSRAQAALARHDAAGALQAIRATARIPERQLVPEELALEAQALRMIGLDQEAAARDTELKARYPESALAR